MSISTLRRDVYAEVGRAIKTLGFRKVARRQLFAKELSCDIEGVLELTGSRRGDELAVSLGVGLVLTEVERLIADWHGEESADWRFTVFGNVGYLKPDRGWLDTRFREGQLIDEGIRTILGLVTSEAVPFLEEHASLKGAANLLESRPMPLLNQKVNERLPVIYALDGDEERAAASLAVVVDALASDDVSSLTLRRHAFVEGFRNSFPGIK